MPRHPSCRCCSCDIRFKVWRDGNRRSDGCVDPIGTGGGRAKLSTNARDLHPSFVAPDISERKFGGCVPPTV